MRGRSRVWKSPLHGVAFDFAGHPTPGGHALINLIVNQAVSPARRVPEGDRWLHEIRRGVGFKGAKCEIAHGRVTN
jgi:hypothetical protein